MKGRELEFRGIRMPVSAFFLTLGVMWLICGMHVGLIVGLRTLEAGDLATVLAVVLYWIAVSLAFLIFTRAQISKYYERPVQRIASAAAQVAEGDFSVYLPPMNMPDRLDDFDMLIHSFNRMVEALGSMETLKTEFFSNVSHEIKTPIAVVMNTAELLRNEQLSPQQRQEYVETIVRASRQLSTLIADILKLNRLEKQAITPQAEPYDLCAQLCDCALQFEEIWEKKGIEFEADLEDQAIVCLDESLMALVWNNLLSNAFKFTEAGGSVTMAQRSTDEGIVVTVRDSGCGMDEKTVAHIFDKFYQGDTSHATEGNGLGLAPAKRILELTDCTIRVESAPGAGTAFDVVIPAEWKGN